jgi:hypothetical protein
MKVVLFPIAMIVLSAGAAISYAFDGDLRRVAYWTAAAIITASVTF